MLEPTLSILEHSELIRATQRLPELEYIFKHALVQETTYESLLKHDRRRLQRLVAEALERVYAGHIEGLASDLARHWDEAGDSPRAFAYYLRAGDHAVTVYANLEALIHYDRARELAAEIHPTAPQLLELYTRRGRTLELRNEYDAALANYQELQDIAERAGDPALLLQALIRRTTIHSTPTARYEPKLGSKLAQRALDLANTLGDRAAQAQVLWNLLLLNHFERNYPRAIAFGEQSLALARELGLLEQQAYTLNDLTRPYGILQRLTDAQAARAEAEQLWRKLGNLPMLADNLGTAAASALYLGRYQEGLVKGEEAHRISREIDNKWGMAFSAQNLALIHMELGEIADALALFRESIALGEQSKFFIAKNMGELFTGFVLIQMGAFEQAIRYMHQVVETDPKNSDWIVGFNSMMAIACARQGELTHAQEHLTEALNLYRGEAGDPSTIGLRSAQLEFALAQRDFQGALRIAADALDRPEQTWTRPFINRLRLYQAIAFNALGNAEQAYAILISTIEEAEGREARLLLWLLYAELAKMEKMRGDPGAAQEQVRQACEAVQYIAAHTPTDAAPFGVNLRASFLARREVRELECES